MDCVSPILGVATRLWDCSAKRIDYIRDLEKNLKSLSDEMNRLEDISKDVKIRVDLEEEQQMRRTNQVNGWLQSVETMEKEVKKILQRGDQEMQNKCLGSCCPKNCWSNYKFGKIVAEKLNAVTQLKNEGRFDAVADKLPRPQVVEKPLENTVGLESTFAKVWRGVSDDNVGIIGLYGMGGVGKTTLLKKLNNEFVKRSHDFDLVIWAGVSKDANVETVQDAILKRLRSSNVTGSQDENATEIYSVLSKKRFVLLLDDLWKRLDLSKVGVPQPDNQSKSKVVFTTRSEDVCSQMEAKKKFRIECLPWKEAWELFQTKVGEEALNLHPDIPQLAMVAAKECGGLPIALITIGRAMASKKTLQEWKHALELLKNAPSKFSGMGDEVYHRLKISYDSLSDDTVRTCFIYCSLYPGGISSKSLVDLWLGEGFLGEFDDINKARNQGHDIIESLKLACLLESSDITGFVKMHDVIRYMALWIACECGRKMGKFVVQEGGGGLIEAREISKWKEAERISLSGDANAIEKLNETPICSNLLTLFVRRKLNAFPSGFFQFMPVLRVLDLSRNRELTELPAEISRLVSLQYLDLSFTRIRELPIGFKNLVNLKFLRLIKTHLEIIPKQVISSLPMLQVFDLRYSNTSRCQTMDGNVLSGGNEVLLAELECLEHLKDIGICVNNDTAFQLLVNSQKLRSRTFGLTLHSCEGLTSLPLSSLRDMKHLEMLEINDCVDLKEIAADWVGERRKGIAPEKIMSADGCFNNLTQVILENCQFSDLTWLICIPSLEYLRISSCKSIEEVICDYDHGCGIVEFEETSSIFSSLQYLYLSFLPELKSISRHALPFPSLMTIIVISCPKLKKLPLDSNSAKKNNLRMIRGKEEWLEGLEWDDDATRLQFLPYFQPSMF